MFCQFVTEPRMTVDGAAPTINFIFPLRQGGTKRR